MMKKSLLILSTLLFMGFVFSGCSKDDVVKTNYFNLGDEEYDLSKGFLEDYGPDGAGFNLDLTLFSSSLTLVEEDGEFFDFDGIGNAMYFEIFTETEGDLAEGTYVFDESYDPGTFDIGYVAVDYNSEDLSGNEFEVTAGNITLVRDGSLYNITLDLTLNDGQTLFGSYSGDLGYYDYASSFSFSENPSVRRKNAPQGKMLFKTK